MVCPTSPHPGAVSNELVTDEGKQAHTTDIQPNRSVIPVHDGDAALHLLKGMGGARRSIDPKASKRLLRKIDLHIMPLICIV